MRIGQTGQPYKPGEDKLEEKIIYRFDADGHALLIVKTGITLQEVENIQQGTVELGIYIDGPILFLLFKLGSGKWNDVPFSWHTVPRDDRAYPEEVTEKDVLKVGLVEAADGVVRAVREVALDEVFAETLHAAITAQAKGSFNGLSYGKHLNMVYNQYTTEDMLDLANVLMIAK